MAIGSSWSGYRKLVVLCVLASVCAGLYASYRAHYALGETAGMFTGVLALTACGLLSAVGLVGKTIVFRGESRTR